MLGLGLAASHAPSMFRPAEYWPEIHRVLTEGVPQPREFEKETPQVVREYVARVEKGFAVLKKQVEDYRPDALIVIGDDQGEVFHPERTPGLCIFTAPEVRGSLNIGLIKEPEEENHVTIRCHLELALYLRDALPAKGFELAAREEVKAEGKPKRGMGHAFTRPVVQVVPKLNVPTVNIHVNAYFPPLPSAQRCYDLGRAIARALDGRKEKVAIMASGGLSHDPRGPRAGWIDTALDRWVLRQLETGNGEELCSLFRFDSDSLSGGTGEIRSWIVVAGAFAGRKANIVDYVPAHHAVTGLGFAYWPPDEVAAAENRSI